MESKILFFLNYLKTVKHASQNTLESYKRDLEAMKEYFYSQDISELEKVNGTCINSYVLYMEKCGKSPASIARSISAIKTFFRCMINNGYVKREPTESINAPEQDRAKNKSKNISSDEAMVILESIKGEDSMSIRDKAMLELIYDSGIKVTELIGLKISDINLQFSYVTCHGMKKDKTVPFSKKTGDILLTYINNARDSLLKQEKNDFLFLNRFGKPMTRQGFWKIFKGYAESAGVEGVSTHSLAKKRTV